MNRKIEKGVDTAIVTDIFGLVWENALEVILLASSDRDYIPAVQMLSAKGFRVINSHIPPRGMHLARTCWASIDMKTGLGEPGEETRRQVVRPPSHSLTPTRWARSESEEPGPLVRA